MNSATETIDDQAGTQPGGSPRFEDEPVWRLFSAVLWPAAAGNVLWALLSVANDVVKRDPSHPDASIDWLAALPMPFLLVLGYYLCAEWERTFRQGRAFVAWKFALADGAHLLLVSWAAICVASNPRLMVLLMFLFFCSCGLGHFFDAWGFKAAREWRTLRGYRLVSCSMEAVCALAALALYGCWPMQDNKLLSLAATGVLILSLCLPVFRPRLKAWLDA
jgi:hypothetical protein